MRMKQSRLRTLYLKNKSVSNDNEGVPIIAYGAPVTLSGEVWPATSKLQIETYGNRISAIMNCRIKGAYSIKRVDGITVYDFGGYKIREDDGLCIYADSQDSPDYRIITIKPYNNLYMEIEKL